jgi:glycosyltransferase involved in cell wall biosynthesis
MKLVSICCPTWNGEEFLADNLNSCLGQSYKKIEVIIVDDGSTDGTQQVLDYFVRQDKRIKPFKIKHSGISVARKTAFEKSKGDYIAIMDTDCVMEPTRIRKSVDKLEKSKADIVYTPYAQVEGQYMGIIPTEDINKEIKGYKDILDRKYPNAHQIVPNFTILARRECFKGAYRPEFKVNDDLWTILYWLKKGYKFALLNSPLTMHFAHQNNVSRVFDKEVRKITEILRKEEGV